MALNPKTIKTLFGKLAPMADDVAEGVVKYGDDVADDLTRLSAYVSRHNARSPEVPLPVKTALQAPTLNSMGLPINEPSGVLVKLSNALDDIPVNSYSKYKANRTLSNALDNAGWRGNINPTQGITDWLGQGRLDEDIYAWGGPRSFAVPENGVSISVPELPLDQIVSSSSTRRPHKNTALGKWFEKVKNDPNKLYDDGIREIAPNLFEAEPAWIFDPDDLPF